MSLQSGKVRVAHLVSHPIQYFAPLYRALAQRPEIDLTVYFYSIASLHEHNEPDFARSVKWDVPLIDGYRSVICGDARSRPIAQSFDWKPNWSILSDLFRQKYDVIWIHGYMNANAWLAAALGGVTRSSVLLREEQTLLTPRSSWKLRIKQLILPLMMRHVTGMYIGQSNRAFFEHYGMRSMYQVSYAIDTGLFRRYREELAESRPEIRARFGIAGPAPIVLFSGKFVDKKKPLLLLEAFEQVRRSLRCHLLLVGDGPLRRDMEEQVANRLIPDVHFAGFLNQTDIARAYIAADLLVLPSAYQETWGLVVNEAMDFGLPVVVSDRVGCAADLVKLGENGFVFPSGDADALANAIRQLVASSELRADFGQCSSRIIADFSIEKVADQVVTAVLGAKNSRIPV